MTATAPAISAMPAADYFADLSAWSQSMLKTFLERRRLAQAYYVLQTEPEPPDTDPMRKGTATHTALLEPDRFADLVLTFPRSLLARNGAVSTDAAKAFREEHEAAGRVVLKADQFAAVKAMAESVRRVCGKWLELPGRKEQALYWTDGPTELPLKARLDWIIGRRPPIIFDLKTTTDASPVKFRKRIEDGRYWLQVAQYTAAVESMTGEQPEFYFIAVESTFPFACAIHTLDRASLVAAQLARRRVLNDLAGCLASGDFAEPWERDVSCLALRDFCFDPNS
jgi:exodeoxyribonuclease VIII